MQDPKNIDVGSLMGPVTDCMTPEERVLAGYAPDPEADARFNASIGRLEESAIAVNQELSPQQRMQDRKDLKPWQGKESDGELMFHFESALDAQDLYDFVIESGLLVAGEVRIVLIEGQASVHFAPSVLVTNPDVIAMAMLAYQDQLQQESVDDFVGIAEDVDALISERAASPRGSAEPTAKRGARFNPFHGRDGKFTDREALADGGSWSEGTSPGTKHLKATKKGKKLHFAATKLPCGRMARAKGKNVRCFDGTTMAAKLAAAFGKKKRSGPRAMEDFGAADFAVLQEAWALYGIAMTEGREVYGRVVNKGGMSQLLGSLSVTEGYGSRGGRGRDPYWMTARSDGKDSKGNAYKKGDEVFYYPNTKTILAGDAAKKASREFDAARDDEAFMNM